VNRYDDAMTAPEAPDQLRGVLIDAIRAGRDAERTILAALDPVERDAPAEDGGWSAKDIQAHLSAWRQRQSARLAARREGRDADPEPALETDEVNAVIHAERADWPWDRVLADADSTAGSLSGEIRSASDETLAIDRVIGSIMGDGPEHALAHLPPLAARVGQADIVRDLAAGVATMIDGATLPARPAAFARYNLACFHAKEGRLDEARSLLRLALPDQEELRTLAPTDDDLIALRDEIPTLIAG
jgi:hypothetical protein